MISKCEITVRYAETDQMGIAHHANYPVWYEAARTKFMKDLGLSYTEMEKLGIIVPLLELQCRYKKPALYEDELIVEVRAEKVTPVKLEFSYRIYKKGQEDIINTGKTVHGMLGKNMYPVNVKKEHPKLYAVLSKAAADEREESRQAP